MSHSPFTRHHAPKIGETELIAPGIRAITAGNASPMTFTGTRSYLLGHTDLVVVDPGPDDAAHLDAILSALEPDQSIAAIAVTHNHVDHSPLARRLGEIVSAPVYAFGRHDAARNPIMEHLGELGGGEGIDTAFEPDICLRDGERLVGESFDIEAVHLPGHLSNHMGFACGSYLLSGDHVMGWATTLISPPDGDLSAFMASLDRLLDRPDAAYLPGHGPVVTDPKSIVRHIRDHRQSRDTEIRRALEKGPATARGIVSEVYRDIPVEMHAAAERNVLAHLIDLTSKNVAAPEGELTKGATFSLL